MATIKPPKNLPPAKLLREIGKRIDYAITARKIPRDYVASTIGLTVAELDAFSKGKAEPSGRHSLALSVLLSVEPDWLVIGGMTPTLTAKSIDQIIYNEKKPPTFRELVLLGKTLSTSPYFIQWITKGKKRQTRGKRASSTDI